MASNSQVCWEVLCVQNSDTLFQYKKDPKWMGFIYTALLDVFVSRDDDLFSLSWIQSLNCIFWEVYCRLRGIETVA